MKRKIHLWDANDLPEMEFSDHPTYSVRLEEFVFLHAHEWVVKATELLAAHDPVQWQTQAYFIMACRVASNAFRSREDGAEFDNEALMRYPRLDELENRISVHVMRQIGYEGLESLFRKGRVRLAELIPGAEFKTRLPIFTGGQLAFAQGETVTIQRRDGSLIALQHASYREGVITMPNSLERLGASPG